MLSRRLAIIFALLGSLITAGMLTGCTGPAVTTGSLRVEVRDMQNNLLSGAKVISNTQPEGQLKVTGSTDSNGIVLYKDIKAGEYDFYVNRFNYIQKNNIKIFVAGGKTTTITVNLEASQ